MMQMAGRYEYLAERIFKSLRGVEAILCDLDVDTWSEERVIARVVELLDEHDAHIATIEQDAVDRTRTWIARSVDSPIQTDSPAYLQMTRATADRLAKQQKTKYGSLAEASKEVAAKIYQDLYSIESVDFSGQLEEQQIIATIASALERYADLPEPAIRAVERLAGIEALFPSVREQLLAGSLGRAVLGTDYNVIPYSVEWNCLFDTFIAEADRKIATNDFDTTTLADLRPTVIAFSDRIPGSPKLGLDGAPVVRNKRGRKPGSKNKDIKVEERITDLGVMDSVIDGAALRTSKN